MEAHTKIMGLDYGERRIGVALSDINKIIATGHCTIDCRAETSPLKAISALVEQENVEAIVVGYPERTDGLPGGKVKDVDAWIGLLEQEVSVPIHRQDESYTTHAARDSLRSRGKKLRKSKDKQALDRVAACFILQAFLDGRGVRS